MFTTADGWFVKRVVIAKTTGSHSTIVQTKSISVVIDDATGSQSTIVQTEPMSGGGGVTTNQIEYEGS